MPDPLEKPKPAFRINPKALDASLIPTMIGVGTILGYFIGSWIGSFFPDYKTVITGFATLYGLAAGLYQAYKILKRIIRDQEEDERDSK
jgi:uncharacterized membrane protein YfcA